MVNHKDYNNFFKIIMVFVILIIVLVVINLQIVSSQDNNEEKEEQLKKLGFTIDKDKSILKYVDIVKVAKWKNIIKITKEGSKKEIDVSSLKGRVIIEVPFGGRFKDKRKKGNSEYVGGRSLVHEADDIFVFGKGHWDLTVNNGEIYLGEVKLAKGSILGGISTEGEIEDYNWEQGIIFSMKGKPITRAGFTYTPANGKEIEFSGLAIKTNGNDVVVKDNQGNYIGIFNGYGRPDNLDKNSFHLFGDDTPSSFTNYKGTKIETTEFVIVTREGGVNGENLGTHRVIYNGDLIVIPDNPPISADMLGGVANNLPPKIEIFANDKDYGNIVVKSIATSLEVNMHLEKEVNGKIDSSLIIFNNEGPLLKGSMKGFKTNIGHMIRGEDALIPWMIYNGEIVQGNQIGEVHVESPLDILSDIKDKEIKKLLIKSMDFYGIDNTKFADSIKSQIGNDNELKNSLVNNIINYPRFGNSFYLTKALFEITQDNSDAQINLINKFANPNVVAKNFNELIQVAQGNLETQKKLLENYAGGLDYTQSQEILKILKGSSDYEALTESVRLKTNGVMNPDEFRSLPLAEQKALLEKTNFYNSNGLNNIIDIIRDNGELTGIAINNLQITSRTQEEFKEIFYLLSSLEQNPSAQEQLLSSYDVIGDSIWNPMNMREEIKSLNVEATEKLLKYSSAYYKKNPNYYPGWDSEKMAQVYQNSEFLLETNGFGNVEKWSIGLSAIRRLEQQGMELSSANLGSAINEIISAREQNKERVILGKDTTYIPITNDEKWGDDFISRMIGERGGIPIGEPRFLEEGMVKLARDSGVAEGNIVRNLRGEGAKPVILSTIGDSKGSTTIHFGAHGGEKHQMLTQGGAGEGFGLNEPGAISYVELGDALIQRVKNGESLKNVNILFDSCHSYDFTKNLYEHLQTEGKGIVMDLPYIITETNRGQVGKSDFNDAEFGSSFLRGLYETKQRNNPLILNNVYQAERSYFGEEDGAIFIPSGSGVLPIGSSHDDLEVPKPVDSEEKSPTYLEISQIESEMQKKLVA